MMGRRKGERRLADPVIKMADELMADGAEILNLENRPFHRAYLSRKLPCPHILCRAELGRAFFEETGLVQHVRVSPFPFPPSHFPSRFSPFSRETTGDESGTQALPMKYSLFILPRTPLECKRMLCCYQLSKHWYFKSSKLVRSIGHHVLIIVIGL